MTEIRFSAHLCLWMFLLVVWYPYSTAATNSEDHHIEILLKEPRQNTKELSVLHHLLDEVRDIKQILKTEKGGHYKVAGDTGLTDRDEESQTKKVDDEQTVAGRRGHAATPSPSHVTPELESGLNDRDEESLTKKVEDEQTVAGRRGNAASSSQSRVTTELKTSKSRKSGLNDRDEESLTKKGDDEQTVAGRRGHATSSSQSHVTTELKTSKPHKSVVEPICRDDMENCPRLLKDGICDLVRLRCKKSCKVCSDDFTIKNEEIIFKSKKVYVKDVTVKKGTPSPVTDSPPTITAVPQATRTLTSAVKTLYKEPKTDGLCTGADCSAPANVKAKDEQSKCILFKTMKTFSQIDMLVQLPFPLTPGMKLTVNGRYNPKLPYCQLTITKNPDMPTNIFHWLHIRLEWKQKRLAFTEGITNSYYKGDFPVSDPSNFTLEVELTPSSTNIYVDKVLVKSMNPIPKILECHLRKYGFAIVTIQKLGEGCDQEVIRK